MRTSRTDSQRIAGRGATVLLALIAACGGKDPTPGGADNSTTTNDGGINPDGNVDPGRDGGPTSDAVVSTDGGDAGTLTVSLQMWRPDSPQGEVAIDDDFPNGPLVSLVLPYCNGISGPGIAASQIPAALRTGRMTPTELVLSRQKRIYGIAFYREGYVSSTLCVDTLHLSEPSVMFHDERLALDLSGDWVETAGPDVGSRRQFTIMVNATGVMGCISDIDGYGDGCIRLADLPEGYWVYALVLGDRLRYHTRQQNLAPQVEGTVDRQRIAYDVSLFEGASSVPSAQYRYVFERR